MVRKILQTRWFSKDAAMTATIPKFNRRQVLKLSALGIAGCFLPDIAVASVKMPLPRDRYLSFYNTHTREKLTVHYCKQGMYCEKSLNKVNLILRDHRSDDIYPIDPKLLDLLFKLTVKLGTDDPFHIISGYRSPATNAILRKRSNGVARKSFHTVGKAIDIRLPGLNLNRLRKTAVSLNTGGVGFYPQSDFVHVDVGPIRYW